MKKMVSLLIQCFCGFAILLFIVPQPVLGAAKITGKVIQRRHNFVKVTFKAQKNASPAIGDRVDFSKLLKGYKAKGGYGVVTETSRDFVWVKIKKKPVKVKMTGIILATGGGRVLPKRKKQAGSHKPDMSKWQRATIHYYKSNTKGIKLRIPSDWDFDKSERKTGWMILTYEGSRNHDMHVRIKVLHTKDKTLRTLKKMRKSIAKNTHILKILTEPHYVYLDGHKSLYVNVLAKHTLYTKARLSQGKWNLMAHEMLDRGRIIYLIGACKTTVCTNSVKNTLQAIIDSATFF